MFGKKKTDANFFVQSIPNEPKYYNVAKYREIPQISGFPCLFG